LELFLLWRSSRVEARDVRDKLRNLLAPLFVKAPEVIVRRDGNPSLVVAHAPVPGWKRPFFEEDHDGWAQAIEYPLDWRGSLLSLTRRLEENPAESLRELSPPFSLLWGAPHSGEISLQNDGLGAAQLFEYEDEHLWAVTNRIPALKALGVTLQPDAEQWAAATTLGWFPMNTTGYRRVKLLAPGTQLRVSANEVRRTTVDVLGDWVHPVEHAEPPERSEDEWLEIGRASLLHHIDAASSGWDDASVGLTGGWDSRAVVSSLRVVGAPFRARVKGHASSADVTTAQELARIAGISLRHDHSAEKPSNDPEEWRRSIARSLLWQGGQMDFDKHKTLFADGRRLDDGAVNVMGQHGEIARAYHYGEAMRRFPDGVVPDDPVMEERFVARRLAARLPYLRTDLIEPVREIIRAAFLEAHRHHLTGTARLDFFYLFENTRRGNAASLAAQTGIVVTPLLNPDFIRAAFALRPKAKAGNALHRHIVSANSPEWDAVPYEGKDDAALQRGESRYYDARRSWREVGAPLIEDALRNGGFWTEVFDPDAVRQHVFESPDELAMLAMVPEVLGE
jgi:hypothetical protein